MNISVFTVTRSNETVFVGYAFKSLTDVVADGDNSSALALGAVDCFRGFFIPLRNIPSAFCVRYYIFLYWSESSETDVQKHFGDFNALFA